MKNTLIYKHKTVLGTVFLKSRKNGPNPESLYLEVYLKATQKRHLEFLGLHFTGNAITDNKIKQDAILKCCNYIFTEKKEEIRSFSTFWEGEVRKIVKEQSRRNPLNVLKKLHRFAGKNEIPFSLINEKFLLSYREWVLNTLSKGTADLHLSIFMRFANRAQRKGYISFSAYDPIDIPAIGQVIKIPVTLTEDEIMRLQGTSYPKQSICKALMLQFACGQRWGDVKKMTWEQIIYEGGQYKIVLQQEKTEKVLPSFISKDLMDWVGQGKERKGLMFAELPSSDGVIISHLRNWCALASIEKTVGTHTMRRSCATILYKKGVPLFTISKILGHSKTDITLRYIGLDEADIRKGLDALKGITDNFTYSKAS